MNPKTQARLSFATKQEAIDHLLACDWLTQSSKTPGTFWRDGYYLLSHGEYSKPDYKVVRYKDGWGVKIIYYYYGGTLYAPEDGRIEWDIFEDDENEKV